MEDEVIPTIEGLADYLQVGVSTIKDWEAGKTKAIEKEKRQEFTTITQWLRSSQAKELINGGLSNKMNSTITKLMLGKHGYSDKQELTGKDGKDLFNKESKKKTDNLIDKILG